VGRGNVAHLDLPNRHRRSVPSYECVRQDHLANPSHATKYQVQGRKGGKGEPPRSGPLAPVRFLIGGWGRGVGGEGELRCVEGAL